MSTIIDSFQSNIDNQIIEINSYFGEKDNGTCINIISEKNNGHNIYSHSIINLSKKDFYRIYDKISKNDSLKR
jgi:hypothetical protein